MLMRILLGLSVLAAMALGLRPAHAQGTLVIAGGGLKAETLDVWQAFVGARPADFRTILIIAAASAEPIESARSAGGALYLAGAKPDEVDLSCIGLEPPSAPAECAASTGADELARIARAGAIWFTGGDQSRITRALRRADGGDTPLLAAIRARLKAGAVIGGTSAGAAIMSDPMIASGDARIALGAPVRRMGVGASGQDGEGLVLAPGLGFLPEILADQHFTERSRLGRLLVALGERPRAQRVGLGVDEDTAIIIDLARRQATVAGKGRVWLVDARRARLAAPPLSAGDVRLTLAAPGQRLDLRRLALLSSNGARR